MSLDDILSKHNTEPNHGPAKQQTSSRSFPVWLIPFTIILGFGAMFLIVLWPQFKPAIEVQTQLALPLFGEQASAEEVKSDSKTNREAPAAPPKEQEPGKLLFQAAGWLEPNPLPERVSSLVSGTIGKTYVTDGDKVEKGQLLAELIDTDYRFALDDSKAQLAEAEAEIVLKQKEIETSMAQIRMDEANLEAAKAVLQNLSDTHDRYNKLPPGVVSDQAVIKARQELRQQDALVNVAEAKLDTAKTGLHEKQAKLKSVMAARDRADVAFKHAGLNLERCKIYSPISGRVLKMLSTPGSRLNVDSDDAESSTLAHLYDPNELSLRMDVPIEQSGNVFIGQPSQVRCAMFPDKIFTGKVIRIAGEADIQRNALQVRVRLDNPDDMLRPSMPCRAEIFSMPATSGAPTTLASADRPASGGGTGGALVPAAGIQSKESAPYVWIVDLQNKAVKRSITLLSSGNREGYLAVSEGVFPGEPIIINPPSDLKEQDSVRSQSL